MPLWIIFAIISVFSLAGAELSQQYALKKSSSVTDKTTILPTFGIQLLLILIIITVYRKGAFIFPELNLWPYILLSSGFMVIGTQFYFKSLNATNISFSLIFGSFSMFVSTTLGIVFLNETLSFSKFIGILLIFVSVAILTFNRERLERDNFLGLVAGIFFGISYVFDKFVVLQTEPLEYLFISILLVFTFSFMINYSDWIKLSKSLKLIDFKNFFLSGIFYSIFNFSVFLAYLKFGEVGRIDAINNCQIILITFYEVLVLKVTDNLKLKLLTFFVALVGVLILST